MKKKKVKKAIKKYFEGITLSDQYIEDKLFINFDFMSIGQIQGAKWMRNKIKEDLNNLIKNK